MATPENSCIPGAFEPTTSHVSDYYVASITALSTQWKTLSDPTVLSSAWSAHSYNKLLETHSKEYGRLRAWGEETRAILPAASRGSLDDTLRKDTELKATVTEILKKILRQTERTTQITRSDSVKDSDSDGFSESSDSGRSSADEMTEDHSHDPRSSALLRIYRQIREDIDTLYQVSLVIKRPGYARQYIHSTSSHEWDSRIAPFVDFDIRHVHEKIHDWHKRDPFKQEESSKGKELLKREELRQKEQTSDHGSSHKEGETVATVEVIEQRAKLNNEKSCQRTLTMRLAKANTRRREQLFYWSSHPDQQPIESDIHDATAPVLTEDSQTPNPTSVPMSPSHQDNVLPRPQDDSQKEISEAPKSAFTRDTFSIAIISELPNTHHAPRTIYAETVLDRRRTNRVPDPPIISQQDTFTCPYCHLKLSAIQMRDRAEWKRHVFRDLRPYVCTFEDCQNPDKQYHSRHDWVYHEMQMHRRQWTCVEHALKYPTQDLFIEHVKASHSKTASTNILSSLLELSERPIDNMEIAPCALCPEERHLLDLQNHLAEHLESIALFVLTAHAGEEDQEDGKSDRTAGAKVASRTDISNERHPSISTPGSIRKFDWSQKSMTCNGCHHEWTGFLIADSCPQCNSSSVKHIKSESNDDFQPSTWVWYCCQCHEGPHSTSGVVPCYNCGHKRCEPYESNLGCIVNEIPHVDSDGSHSLSMGVHDTTGIPKPTLSTNVTPCPYCHKPYSPDIEEVEIINHEQEVLGIKCVTCVYTHID